MEIHNVDSIEYDSTNVFDVQDITNGETSVAEDNYKSESALLEKIKDVLSSKKMSSSKIASELGKSKKEINKILFSHNDLFARDIFFNWKLKKKN